MKKRAGTIILVSLLMSCAASQKLNQIEFQNLSLQSELIEQEISEKNRDEIQEDIASRQITNGGFYCIVDWNKTILAHPNQNVTGQNVADLDKSLDDIITEFLESSSREVFGEYKNQRDFSYRFCLRNNRERQFIILVMQPQ